jgi:hypothetical protein
MGRGQNSARWAGTPARALLKPKATPKEKDMPKVAQAASCTAHNPI